MECYEKDENSTKKCNLRDESNQQLDEQVYEWFVTQRSKNIPITGPLFLQEQARQISLQLDGPNAVTFKGSNGWLEKFRTRHGIKHRAICGESATVNPVTVDDWKTRRPLIIDKYAPEDVYNADENDRKNVAQSSYVPTWPEQTSFNHS